MPSLSYFIDLHLIVVTLQLHHWTESGLRGSLSEYTAIVNVVAPFKFRLIVLLPNDFPLRQ